MMAVDYLGHTENNRYLSWHIYGGAVGFCGGHSLIEKMAKMQGHSLQGDLQLRFPPSSHLPAPLCPAMLTAARVDSLVGRGEDVPVNEKQNQLIPKVLVGVTPRVWQQEGCEGVSHHPHGLQGKSAGRDRGAGCGNGVRALQS